jgi:DtxR family Mn-dependent transcriptional regulator
MLHRMTDGRSASIASIAGALHISTDQVINLLTSMQSRGLVQVTGTGIELTQSGREAALHIVRAHRLWERHLADTTGYDESEWHLQAERLEHSLSKDELDQLSSQLGHPRYDPHGDPIPTSDGEYVTPRSLPLTSIPVGMISRIVHIEDEPETVYAQLVAEDLHPGMEVRVLDSNEKRIRFWASGDEHLLAPMIAANIFVQIKPEVAAPSVEGYAKLCDLATGEEAQIVSISPSCRGPERRRLMDLGILPGTRVIAELRSPNGDPTAYRIRDSLIALREEQARMIFIDHPVEEKV